MTGVWKQAPLGWGPGAAPRKRSDSGRGPHPWEARAPPLGRGSGPPLQDPEEIGRSLPAWVTMPSGGLEAAWGSWRQDRDKLGSEALGPV